MTRFTISISKLDKRSKALIDYLKTLDFIQIEESNELSEGFSVKEQDAIKKGLKDIEEGNLFSDDEVRNAIRKRISSADMK